MKKLFVSFLMGGVVLLYTPVETRADIFGGLGSNAIDTSFVDRASSEIEKRVTKGDARDLARLYRKIYYMPVWTDRNGYTDLAVSLIKLIKKDPTIVPDMEIYRSAASVRNMLVNASRSGDFRKKMDAEFAMSRLYLAYARYRIYGGIDWKSFDAYRKELEKKYDARVGWDRYAPPISPETLLLRATKGEELKTLFEKAEPRRFGYAKLKRYLLKYIDIRKRGGWQRVSGRSIKPGARSSEIPLIRRHLEMTGDLRGCGESASDSEVYDKCLQKAVRRFRLRNGLKASSTIDKATKKALNVSVEEKIDKIRLNLDRIKWLWRKEERVRIELNIPSFRLYFRDGDILVNTMRVITGKPNHPTPSFHDRMEYIVVNPYWKIPESIVKQEMIKHLLKNPYYYRRQGKTLHKTWSEDSPEVDPGSVNWAKYRGKKHIPYYFMQAPGYKNALGKIKFVFPNHFSVYIHDTPTKKLFFRSQRAFSHGCMRIQKPRELLKTLSLYNENIDVESIMERLTTRNKKTIVLRNKIPVDITYLTAFVDDYGYLNFRGDIYGYDAFQMKNYPYALHRVHNREKSGDRAKTKDTKRRDSGRKKSAEKSASSTKRVKKDHKPSSAKSKSTPKKSEKSLKSSSVPAQNPTKKISRPSVKEVKKTDAKERRRKPEAKSGSTRKNPDGDKTPKSTEIRKGDKKSVDKGTVSSPKEKSHTPEKRENGKGSKEYDIIEIYL
jgi:murein L,D-transpeptidase YcbB/YkuD